MQSPSPLQRSRARFAGVAALLVLTVATARAQQVTANEPLPPASALLAPRGWSHVIERDALLSFPPASASAATAALERKPELALEERPLAWYALAASQEGRERARLEQALVHAPEAEREAIALGLGEARAAQRDAARALLLPLLAGSNDRLHAAACLSLARGGEKAAVEREAAGTNARGAAARSALAWVRDPRASPEQPALAAWLELRFRAAREYGRVAGQTFDALLADELARDASFLEAALLPLTLTVRRPGVGDNLLELVLAEGSPSAVRACAIAMPQELTRLVLSELWRPPSVEAWNALLDAIDEEGLESQALDLLRTALAEPSVRLRAAGLLVRAGVVEAAELLRDAPEAERLARRAELARRYGESGSAQWIGELNGLALDTDPNVQAQAKVALARLGHGASNEWLRQLAAGPASEERSAAVAILCAGWRQPSSAAWLDVFHGNATGEERLRTGAALAQAGRVAPREELRTRLAEPAEREWSRELRLEVLRGLARGADGRDLEILRARYPDEQDRELNTALARALVAAQDPLGRTLARSALWNGSRPLSCLAGALIVHYGGIHALADELESPPPRASASSLRIVGYALGQWGGLDEAERLAVRRGPGDPALQGAYLGALAARTH